MITVVSWHIGKQKAPWRELVRMAGDGDADVALVQEAGNPPSDVVALVDDDDGVFWDRHVYDRWPLVVQLSDRITVTSYRHVPPISDLTEDTIGVSGIGTIAAAKVTPRDSEDEAFIVVSMYARWLKPHPSTTSRWRVGCSDASAHRIMSDLSAFIGHSTPTTHRILAAGDLHMFYGATGRKLSLPARDRTVWARMQALGLECLGPQVPHGRRADCSVSPPTDVPSDTKNVPTYYAKGGPDTAVNQLDDAFASRGFHQRVSVRAMNNVEEWGSSDRCRLARYSGCSKKPWRGGFSRSRSGKPGTVSGQPQWTARVHMRCRAEVSRLMVPVAAPAARRASWYWRIW